MKEITLQELLPNEFYINDKGEMVAEITLNKLNEIADVIENLDKENKELRDLIHTLENSLKNIDLDSEEDNGYRVRETLNELQKLKETYNENRKN